MADQVTTPAELAGSTFESTIRTKAAELKRELIRQTLEDIESWRKAVDVQWEREHPSALAAPIPVEEIQRYKDAVSTEFYEWVEPAFERYLQPDPDAINPMIAALRGNESMFGGSQDGAGNFSPASPVLARINDVRSDMSQWQGDMQVDFIDNFLTPLQTVSLNQASVAKVVREHLECSSAGSRGTGPGGRPWSGRQDIVVTVGQDGLVVNVAKYLDGQPVLGIDPEPGRNPGVLARHHPGDVAGLLRKLAAGTAVLQERTMVRADTDDDQTLVGLNEVYAGHASHQSARYLLATPDGRRLEADHIPLVWGQRLSLGIADRRLRLVVG